MIVKIRESFRNGVSRIQWFATVVAERLRIEMAVIRLLSRSRDMEKKKEELLRSIGVRVYELRSNPERSILKDKAVAEAVGAVGEIEKEMEELKAKASEMAGMDG